MRLRVKTIFRCGHEEIEDRDIFYCPDIHRLIQIEGETGIVQFSSNRCRKCYDQAHESNDTMISI